MTARIMRSPLVAASCYECGAPIKFMFRALVGKPECLCQPCAAKAGDAAKASRDDGSQHYVDDWAERQARDAFAQRLRRSGLPGLTIEVLGITIGNPHPPLIDPSPATARAGDAVRGLVSARVRGVLFLAGPNGVGKSIAAGWASWATRGQYLTRSVWSGLRAWGDTAARVRDLISYPGIVAIDELAATHHTETGEAARTIIAIAAERHDAGLGTVITTRSTQRDFADAHGKDLLDRARAHRATGGSGWIDLTGRSLRGT